MVSFRTPFDTLSVQTHPQGESRTKQCFSDECDINSILRKHALSGMLEHVKENPGTYGDFSAISDYQSSMNQVLAAQEAFDGMSSAVRKRFHNDPALFMDFVHDPSNTDEMIKLGLAIPRKPDEATKKVDEMGSDPVV